MNVVSAPLFQKVMKKRGEVDINSTMVLSMGIGMIITDVLSHSFNKGFPIAFPERARRQHPGSQPTASSASRWGRWWPSGWG